MHDQTPRPVTDDDLTPAGPIAGSPNLEHNHRHRHIRMRDEVLAERHAAGEVLVEGSWFHLAELPTVLGNYMRSAHQYANEAKAASTALSDARTRITELEAAQPAPAGYVVGWEDDGRVEIALDESDCPDILLGPDRHAYTEIAGAYAFLAELTPEDPDTTFRVYELREVRGHA